VFAVRPAEASTHDVLAWLRRNSFRVVATTPAGDVDYARGDYRGNVAIAVGSERHGLPDAWLAAADRCVAIPMHGAADSLNVAVASGVVLFQAVVDRDRARSSSL
jgi:TrmH family RNA methyltransferase